jgi:hypothetical protein
MTTEKAFPLIVKSGEFRGQRCRVIRPSRQNPMMAIVEFSDEIKTFVPQADLGLPPDDGAH